MFKNISMESQTLLLCNLETEELDDLLLLGFLQRPVRQKFTRSFNLELLSDTECWRNFRFEKEHLPRLQAALRIPPYVITPNRLKVPGIEATCILLRRMAYPNRLSDIAPMFRRSQIDISLIFSTVVGHIYDMFRDKIEILNQPWLDCNSYSRAIQNKGAPLDNCIGFLDGTVRPIARPTQNQRLVYNGHKRVHALKFQSLMLPNGIIGHMYGPMEGRRHDSALLAESNILNQLDGLGNICVYGDQGYPIRRNLICPFRGAQLSPQETEFNNAMSTLRTSVEWGFGDIIKQFAFLDFKKNQKLLLQPVGKYYLIGTLIANCRTCLYGNQTSSYFELNPPTLEEYLQ